MRDFESWLLLSQPVFSVLDEDEVEAEKGSGWSLVPHLPHIYLTVPAFVLPHKIKERSICNFHTIGWGAQIGKS